MIGGSWARRSLFYRQLAVLLRSGFHLTAAVPLAAGAAGGPWPTRTAPWAAQDQRPLSELATGEPPLVRALLQAGERTGRLPDVCDHVADLGERLTSLQRHLLGRLWNPLLLIHVAMMIPALPRLVRGDAWLADLLLGPGLLWATVALVWWGIRMGWWDGLAARVAVVLPLSWLTEPLVAERVAEVAGAAHAAGLYHREALVLAAAACGNRVVADRLRHAADDLDARRVPSLAEALRRAGLTADAVGILTAAEAGGRLDQGFRQVAVLQQDRFRRRADLAVRVLGGLIYAGAAAYAAMTALQMYSEAMGSALGS